MEGNIILIFKSNLGYSWNKANILLIVTAEIKLNKQQKQTTKTNNQNKQPKQTTKTNNQKDNQNILIK